MVRPNYVMFVERDRTSGWRDRSPAYRVMMQLPGLKRAMTDGTDHETAVRDLAELLAEAGKLLLQDIDQRIMKRYSA